MARERRGNSKSAAADRRRPQKKKISILNTEQVEWIDYKDVNLLRRFMSERAKIRARRVTGNSAQQQREVAKAIRVAREMALLPEATEELGEGVTLDEVVVTGDGVGDEAVMVEAVTSVEVEVEAVSAESVGEES
jgi:ribosomal protein S18